MINVPMSVGVGIISSSQTQFTQFRGEGKDFGAQGWEQRAKRRDHMATHKSEVRNQRSAIRNFTVSPVFNLSISFRLALRFILSSLLHAPCLLPLTPDAQSPQAPCQQPPAPLASQS